MRGRMVICGEGIGSREGPGRSTKGLSPRAPLAPLPSRQGLSLAYRHRIVSIVLVTPYTYPHTPQPPLSSRRLALVVYLTHPHFRGVVHLKKVVSKMGRALTSKFE